jgi:hypothetical protein
MGGSRGESGAAAIVFAPRQGCRKPGPRRYLPHMETPEVDLPKEIGAPATRALVAAGYTRLAQLDNVPTAELKHLHGVGPRAITRLAEALAQQGMSLG